MKELLRDYTIGSIIAGLIMVGTFFICKKIVPPAPRYEYTLTYDIYWSDSNVERKTCLSSSPISVNSHHGINYVSSNYTIERTTAPIRKVSYTQTKI